MRLSVSFLIVVSLLLSPILAHSAEDIEWPKNTRTAVSLSYDDALNSQLDHAVPALDKHDFKATFYLIVAADAVRERMGEWRDLASRGHELGNHTIYHACSGSLPDRDWVSEDNDLDSRSIEQIKSEVLTANTTGISNNTGALSYLWKRDGSDISGATQDSYTLVLENIATSITVEVNSSVESGSLSGGPSALIGKADQSAPAAPVMESKNHNTIILVQTSGTEYAINTGLWQSSNAFSSLDPETLYTLSQRLSETATHNASSASPTLSVTTDAAPVETFTVSITVKNSADDPLEGAQVNLSAYGTQTTNVSGIVTFEDVAPVASIGYTVILEDYNSFSGSLTVSDANVEEEVVILATGIFTETQPEIKVYPIPASTHLIVENVEGRTLTLYSITGELIEQRSNCQPRETLDVSGWIPGIYLLRSEGFYKKFIVN